MTQRPFTLTNQAISDSINNWKNISRDGKALVTYFEQGNCFFFDISNYSASSSTEITEDIHAYPGIYNDSLIFMLIPSQYDNEAYAKDISQYVSVSPVFWSLGGGRIPEGEAKHRMERWNNHYKTWVPKQAETADGIFLAFKIDAEDFEMPDSQVNFALRANLDDPFGHAIADLVVTNKDETRVFYDDYVEPVPPFSASASVESFYLLQL
ncbi:hypothetical protein E0W68_04380 [Flavobacterium salilacus subsp. salilacus]|uniref:hypothetical protein n=1 Tax=Flavobacterium TaxID=237 RepID=UPI001074DEF5|nr:MULTISPECIES: hypothetical protein [Flavobacterium]KAF2519587.1 hypothetical protein E0W68_04380 [Flavobacterium salilacus subsp. salilacus]MBE1614511.1 hypothetical protein [Flavobacterium sp. SaA2.13]